MTLPEQAHSARQAGKLYPTGEHRISWFLIGKTIQARIICDSPAGTYCQLVCPHGCEKWENNTGWPCGEDKRHTLVYSQCRAAAWLKDADIADYHTGKGLSPLTNGPVEVQEKQDDRGVWTWQYPQVKRQTKSKPQTINPIKLYATQENPQPTSTENTQ